MSLNGHIENCEVINMRSKHLFEYLPSNEASAFQNCGGLFRYELNQVFLARQPVRKVSGSKSLIRDKSQLQMNGYNT